MRLGSMFDLRHAVATGLMVVMASLAPAGAQTVTALPESTYFYASAPTVTQLREGLAATGFGQLLQDPAMTPFKDEIAGRLEEVNAQMQEAMGVTLGELLDLPQGEVSLAVVPAIEGDVPVFPVALLVVADAGANDATMLQLMNELTKLAEEEGATVRTEMFEGYKLNVILPPGEEEGEIVWTNKGSTYYISVGRASLEAFLTGLNGDRDNSLQDADTFQQIRERVGSGGDFTFYLDLQNIIATVLDVVADQQGVDPNSIDAYLEIFGVKQILAYGGSVSLSDSDLEANSESFLLAPGQPTGLLQLVRMPPTELSPEPWVPAEVATYTTFSWDLDEAYEGIQNLVDTFVQPGFLGVLEQQLVGPDGAPLSFEEDFFGPLGNRVTTLARIAEPVTVNSQQSIFAIALEDSEAFEGSLQKLFGLANLQPDRRNFQGVTIYDIDLSGMVPAQPGAPQVELENVSICIAQDYVMIATAPEFLESVLRGGSSLADDAEFQALASRVPGEVSLLTFSRAEPNAKLFYDLFAGGQFAELVQAGQMAGAPEIPDLGELIDLDTLPEFEVIAKYLRSSMGYWIMESDGLSQVQYSLRNDNP